MDTITLTDCQVHAIIGILDFEQQRRQPLDVEIDMFLPLEPAAQDEEVSSTVDYAAITSQVELLARAGRWWLLESLATTICRMVLIPPAPGEARADVKQVDVRLRKPTILDGRAVPGIRMQRDTAWCRIERERLEEGLELDWLAKTRLCDVARLRMAAGQSYTLASNAEALGLAGMPAAPYGSGQTLTAGTEGATALVVWQRLPN